MLEIEMQSNFEQIVLNSPKPVILKFSAIWCAPCKVVAKHLKSIETEFGDKITIVNCDTDINPEIAERFDIRSIPALLFFNNRDLIHKINGLCSQSKIEEALEKEFGIKKEPPLPDESNQ